MSDHPTVEVDADEAARILEVAADRIPVLVEEGLLHPVDGSQGQRFDRSEVEAVRLIGG
jgi:maltose-binding protein MalE